MHRRQFLLYGLWCTFGAMIGLHRTIGLSAAASPPFSLSRTGKIAIIIDDIGYSLRSVQPFLDIDVPLTFSILPQLSKSRIVASCILHTGHEVMLHQPMEPYNNRLNPGPGALYVGDNGQRIRMVLERNIKEMPFVKGINNHMGSKFTARQREMSYTIELLKKNGLFFIDSLTSERSVGYQTARQMNVTTACRNIFIDHFRSPKMIMAQLSRLKQVALRNGWAIGIGHPFPETAAAIKRFATGSRMGNVVSVPISKVLPSSGAS